MRISDWSSDVCSSDLHAALENVADAAWERVVRYGALGRTVTLKLRHADCRTITRARSSHIPIADRALFLATGLAMLDALLPTPLGIRLLGLTLSNITGEEGRPDPQPTLPLLE